MSPYRDYQKLYKEIFLIQTSDTMAGNDELVDYIKKQLKAGYDRTTVYNFLLNNKYDKKTVDECLSIAEGHVLMKHDQDALKKSNEALAHMSNLYVYVLIVLGILLAVVLGYFLVSIFSGEGSNAPNPSEQIAPPDDDTELEPEEPVEQEPEDQTQEDEPEENVQAKSCGSISVSKLTQKKGTGPATVDSQDKALLCFQDLLSDCQEGSKLNVRPISNTDPMIMLQIEGYTSNNCEISYTGGRVKKTCTIGESTLAEIAPTDLDRDQKTKEVILALVGEDIQDPSITNLEIGCIG